MKVNYPKTIKVGFAFAIIMCFWSAYDFVIPLLLENAYGLSNAMRGLIMGLDNLLSLFLLPIFGKLSDKTNSKWGRRTPYIFMGTIVAVILMFFVPVSANKALKQSLALRTEIINTSSSDYFYEDHEGTLYNPHALYSYLYEQGATNSDFCDRQYLENNNITKEKYLEIAKNGVTSVDEKGKLQLTDDYKKFVSTGINNYASTQVFEKVTKNNMGSLVAYMIILLLVLIAMATFRSPAVALMPDVTPKPLRSQANAIISLCGGVGGAIAFIIYTVALMINPTAYIAIFAATGGAMLLLLIGFLFLVNEPKLVKECEELCTEYGITDDDETANVLEGDTDIIKTPEELKKEKTSKMISFFLILASIFMWFMGYNAVSSNLSIFTTKTLNLSPGIASIVSGISMGISALAFIPVGMLAVKIGRRKTILLGFALAVVSFILVFFFASQTSPYAVYLFVIFYLIAGFGLIIANVNTFPMVVELSDADNVGKYTGYYYAATMSAQAVTPYFAGLVMDQWGTKNLFLYSALCVVVSIVLMYFVKHGDSKAPPPEKKLEFIGAGDD